MPRKRRDGSPAVARAAARARARDIVRYIGDPVAFVVAETLHQAKDAAEAIEVDYEALPAVASVEDAIEARRAHGRHEAYPNNQSLSATRSATRPRSNARSPAPPTWSSIAW